MLWRAALVTALLGIGVAGAASNVTSVPLLRTTADEERPAAAGGYLVWMQNSTHERRHFDVYARRGTGRPWKVNVPGTQARTGGIDGTTLVYEEIAHGHSDLRLYDLAHRRRLGAPRGVNTRKPETNPSLSRPWLLFVRIDYERGVYRVLLRNLRTGRQIQVEALGGHNPFVDAGQVNGRYAVWASCPDGACDVYRYDIKTRRHLKMPNKDRYQHPQYGPSVLADGTVYFGRSGSNCGSSVKLVRYFHGSARTLLTLPPGQDFAASYAARSGGRVSVLYDRAVCSTRRFDVYKVVDRTRASRQ
jgi:hypothetical protein